MSHELAISTIKSALDQQVHDGKPQPELWPLQTLDKNDNGAFWFTLGLSTEKFQRILTLRFDQTLEVLLPGEAYRLVCRPQILNAIREFWDGITSESSRVVQIKANFETRVPSITGCDGVE